MIGEGSFNSIVPAVHIVEQQKKLVRLHNALLYHNTMEENRWYLYKHFGTSNWKNKNLDLFLSLVICLCHMITEGFAPEHKASERFGMHRCANKALLLYSLLSVYAITWPAGSQNNSKSFDYT